MLFGMQPAPAQVSAAQLADAQMRLQRRMENDPSVTTMQPGGVAVVPEPMDGGPAPSSDAAPVAEQPFVWGEGGQRMTPDAISARSRIAQSLMASGSETSPVGHWLQGAARLAQAVSGSLQERRIDKAEQANRAQTSEVARLLAAGGNGVTSAAYDTTLMGAATNPYIDASVRDIALRERERIAKANAPDFFMSGNDRVRYDPKSGQSAVVYDAPEEFQTYAQSMGYKPGTPEYETAAQDYVLRGNGPTAYQYDARLEGDRQDNRLAMEGERQGNRLRLRGTPTFSDLHPRPRAAGGSSGGGGGSRQPTMAGTMAPILGKVSRGQTLTPAEQQAWNMYRPPNRGRKGPTVAGALVAGSPSAEPPRVKSSADYDRVAPGAAFIDPNGVRRVKGR